MADTGTSCAHVVTLTRLVIEDGKQRFAVTCHGHLDRCDMSGECPNECSEKRSAHLDMRMMFYTVHMLCSHTCQRKAYGHTGQQVLLSTDVILCPMHYRVVTCVDSARPSQPPSNYLQQSDTYPSVMLTSRYLRARNPLAEAITIPAREIRYRLYASPVTCCLLQCSRVGAWGTAAAVGTGGGAKSEAGPIA